MHEAIAHIRKKDLHKQPLAEHLSQVGRLAGEFAAKAGLPLSGSLAGLLHDFGKYSTEFQNYIKSATGILEQDEDEYIDARQAKGKIDHSTAGAQRVWAHFSKNTNYLPYAQILALCIASHHCGLIDCLAPDSTPVFQNRMRKEDARTHLSESLRKCDANIQQSIQGLLTEQVMEELRRNTLSINQRVRDLLPPDAPNGDKADNINSKEVQRGLTARFLLSCLLDADRIDSAEFEDPEYKALRAGLPRRPWERLAARLEKHLEGFERKYSVDELRGEISEHCRKRASDPKGLFTLTVPTGGGKTLASLRFALHHAQAQKPPMDRVIYIIPYTSIIDQNAEAARAILEKDEEPGSIVLEHHSNILPENETWRNKLLADNWDAPVVFTTMAQFLESLFGSGLRHARRMHNLADSVLIFDEIQTLPLRCMHLFCNALSFLLEVCGSSAVLCTATQPRLGNLPRPFHGQLALRPEQEIMPDTHALFAALKRVAFFDHCDRRMSVEEIAELALEELRVSGSCLVVCNTKGWAEKVYTQCLKTWTGPHYFLSAHLCPTHRLEKLAAVRGELSLGESVFCVSTQLIECGVDLSFGAVIRFAAGLDSILQAAGRCNRHGGAAQGRVHIVTVREEEEKLDFLQDIKEGRAIYLDAIRHGCAKQLAASGYDLNHPEIIEKYFERYFQRRGDVMAYRTKGHNLLDLLGCNSCSAQMQHPGMLRQAFATAASLFRAIDAPTQSVLVPYGKGHDIIAELSSAAFFNRERALLREAQRYAVNLFPNVIQRLESNNALYRIHQCDILSLREEYYSQELGVTTQPHASMRTYIAGQEE